jgi:hypothetical protein
VAAKDSINPELERSTTIKNSIMKIDMTASLYAIGSKYTSAQTGPISIPSPTTETMNVDTLPNF